MLLVLAATAVAGFEYLAQTRVDPIIADYRAIQAKHLALFQDDQEFLRRFPLFSLTPAYSHDVGELLNPKLQWEPISVTETSGTAKEAPLAPPLAVPRKVIEQVLRYRNDWMRHHHRLMEIAKIDFSIMEALAKYDYWDLEARSPIALLIEEGRWDARAPLPMPRTIDLITLAKLRLAAGAERKVPLAALQQTRSLATLLLTTENMNLQLSALALLDIERRAFRYYVDKGQLQDSAWMPIPRAVTRRAARAIQATGGYLQIWTEIKTLDAVFISNPLPAGFCAAMNEALPKILGLRLHLEHHWPFERDLRPAYRTIDIILARAFSNCRLRHLRRMMQLDRFTHELPMPSLLSVFPYSRKVFGLRFATIPFTGFESYEDPDDNTGL